jgi:Rrf2 family protein
MRISARSEYAVRVLLELGMRNGEDVSLNDVARRWRISLDYLEQLMPPLKKAGLVRSRRGAKGGYAVAKPLDDITVADILEAFDGPVKVMDCLSNDGECWASSACAIQDVWCEVKQAVDGVLRRVTLADLVEQQKRKTKGNVAVYHI